MNNIDECSARVGSASTPDEENDGIIRKRNIIRWAVYTCFCSDEISQLALESGLIIHEIGGRVGGGVRGRGRGRCTVGARDTDACTIGDGEKAEGEDSGARYGGESACSRGREGRRGHSDVSRCKSKEDQSTRAFIGEGGKIGLARPWRRTMHHE